MNPPRGHPWKTHNGLFEQLPEDGFQIFSHFSFLMEALSGWLVNGSQVLPDHLLPNFQALSVEKIHPAGAYALMSRVKVNLKSWAAALIVAMGVQVPLQGDGGLLCP